MLPTFSTEKIHLFGVSMAFGYDFGTVVGQFLVRHLAMILVRQLAFLCYYLRGMLFIEDLVAALVT